MRPTILHQALARLAALGLLCAPGIADAITVTVTSPDENTTLTVNGGDLEDNKNFTVKFTSSDAYSAQYYIMAETSTQGTTAQQIVSGSFIVGSENSVTFTAEEFYNALPSEKRTDGEKTVYVVLEGSTAAGGDENASSDSFTILLDRTAPPPPHDIATRPGDTKLHVSWKAPSTSDGLQSHDGDLTYHVYWDGGDADKVTASSYTVKNLTNKREYEIWVATVDQAGNEGAASGAVTGTPLPTVDFWEEYQDAGGEESGGFCFVATTAFGGYDHPAVQILREFRDRCLLTSAAGRGFVSFYYRRGPAWAAWVDRHAWSRPWVRAGLLPLIGVAYFALEPLPALGLALAMLLLAALCLMLRRRPRRKASTPIRASLVLAAAFLTLGASPARAESPRGNTIDVQFGSLTPQIDNDPGLGGQTPFKDTFKDQSPLWFQFQYGWEFFQDPGTLALGGGPGLYKYSGKARFEDGSLSEDNTSLLVIPLLFGLTYRYDDFALNGGLPLVPYARVGLDYHLWWIKSATGSVANVDGDLVEHGRSGKASGAKWGYHYSLGVQLLLDVFEAHAAGAMDFNYGINNTFFFAEYIHLRVDNFGGSTLSLFGETLGGNGFDLGGDTLLFGLGFEF